MTPSGDPDPTSASEVAEVVRAVLGATGADGLGDLLARLPGARSRPAKERRIFSPATPGEVSLGPEDVVVLSDPVEHRQVVGGVVLHRETPSRGALPDVVAGLVVRLTRAEASHDETALVLGAALEASRRW